METLGTEIYNLSNVQINNKHIQKKETQDKVNNPFTRQRRNRN